MKYLAIAIALLTPVNAFAATTYLECKFPSANDIPVLKITLNEEQSSVATLSPASGSIRFYRNAAFTDTTVEFQDTDYLFMIGRVNLKATRITPVLKQVHNGECTVLLPPKRAF